MTSIECHEDRLWVKIKTNSSSTREGVVGR